jgi:hypothetical protein
MKTRAERNSEHAPRSAKRDCCAWRGRFGYEGRMTLPVPPRLREYLDRLPTTDLYFLNPLSAWRRTPDGARLPPVRNLAPHVYAVGRTGVIVRYGREEDIDRLKRTGAERIVYIVDDDFAAGAEDARLPARYRKKLAAFARGPWPALCDAADLVIVPGAVLAAIHGAKARVVRPAWHLPPADLDHFGKSGRLEMVHLGTGSHVADLAAIAPALAGVVEAAPHARLTLMCGGQAPAPLAGHAQVRVRRPLSWWRYKLALPRMRYHLALYPLADTAFNRARSANKLYEHALVGAASLMSPTPALREAAGPGLTSLFEEGDASDWADRLKAELAELPALRRRAEATRAYIVAADPLAAAVHAWRDILAAEIA